MATFRSERRLALVVSGIAGADELLDKMLEPRGFGPSVFVPTLTELTALLRTRSPALVIVPVDPGSADLAQFESELRRHPNTASIGTSPSKDADVVLAAMRAGINEFLTSPIAEDALAGAMSRVLSRLGAAPQQGRIYTVYSGKGGVGTSTIAASLAYALAQAQGASDGTALVDFNTAGAGLRVMLNLSPLYDMASAASRSDRLDGDYLRSLLVKHPDKVSVLCAAEELDAVDSLELQVATQLVNLLRDQHRHTVIDTDHHFNDQTLAALDAADRILLVTQLDVSALRSAQRSLGVFNRLGYPAEKVMVVVNRRTGKDRITQQGAEKVLGRSINALLPNDYVASAGAITQGEFLQRFAPASPLVGAFRELATTLTGQTASSGDKSTEKKGFARMFGRRS